MKIDMCSLKSNSLSSAPQCLRLTLLISLVSIFTAIYSRATAQPSADHFEPAPQNIAPYEKPGCYANDQFVVITRSRSMDVGEDIFVRPRSDEVMKNQCKNNIRRTDLVVAKHGEANYLTALRKNLLILDKGTGTDYRELSIINMSNGREVWRVVYQGGDPEVLDTKIKILKFVSDGTKKMCKNYHEIIKHDFTPLYVIPVEFSLISLTSKVTGPGLCVAGQ